MGKRRHKLLYLYPNEMNTYGDWGNVQVLVWRAQKRGIELEVIEHRPGDKLPSRVDIIFMGGGQDSGQSLILKDFHQIGDRLTEWVQADVPTLTICGGYQLFGKAFYTQSGEVLEGIGVFDVVTRAGDTRLIGNVQIQSDRYGEVIGFENHSGQTVLGPSAQPFGKVVLGAGNNGKDATEGAVIGQAIGTYLHGPLLPKNPHIADAMLATMIGCLDKELAQLPDPFLAQARVAAKRRPR